MNFGPRHKRLKKSKKSRYVFSTCSVKGSVSLLHTSTSHRRIASRCSARVKNVTRCEQPQNFPFVILPGRSTRPQAAANFIAIPLTAFRPSCENLTPVKEPPKCTRARRVHTKLHSKIPSKPQVSSNTNPKRIDHSSRVMTLENFGNERKIEIAVRQRRMIV